MAVHAMMDLETIGVRKDSVILTIGVLKFDPMGDITQFVSEPKTLEDLAPLGGFYKRVDVESCKALGMHTDPETIAWWRKKPPLVQYEAFMGSDRLTIQQALDALYFWFTGINAIWSNGASFDIPIVADAYSRIGRKPPWSYWNERCVRTLHELSGVQPVKPPRSCAHNALIDCYYQIIGVQRSYRTLFGDKQCLVPQTSPTPSAEPSDCQTSQVTAST